MRIRSRIKLTLIVTSTVACLGMAGSGYGQEFGKFKIDAKLQRKSPPQVYIMNPSISVQVRSIPSSGSAYTRQMASMMESELINKDRRLKPEAGKPETLIHCEITRLDSSENWEERKSQKPEKANERQEWNSKKQKYETKYDTKYVEYKENYKVVQGAINVSYQLKDAKTGAVLDSSTFPFSYKRDFLDGNGAPGKSEIENALVRGVVDSIVPRLVPTTETIKVLLAKGKLEDASKFGERGMWQKMVEACEMMPPMKSQKDDSYRIYNIGVGYEALAYQAEDFATTKKFLEKASALYNQAFEMNPHEKYFTAPQLRIEQAITQYKKLDEQIAAYDRAKELKEREGSKDVGPGPDKTFNNQDVINLAKKGLDEPNLIAAINEAPTVKFDLSPQALGDLLQNKISNAVITAMRTRQSGKRVSLPVRPRGKKTGKG